jgi:hypothetical protein
VTTSSKAFMSSAMEFFALIKLIREDTQTQLYIAIMSVLALFKKLASKKLNYIKINGTCIETESQWNTAMLRMETAHYN